MDGQEVMEKHLIKIFLLLKEILVIKIIKLTGKQFLMNNLWIKWWNTRENAVTTYTVESESFSLLVPTKKGYTFIGWYDNPKFTVEVIAQIEKGSWDNRKYYAKWENICFTRMLLFLT